MNVDSHSSPMLVRDPRIPQTGALNLNLKIGNDRSQQSYLQFNVSPNYFSPQDKPPQEQKKGNRSLQQLNKVYMAKHTQNSQDNSPYQGNDSGAGLKTYSQKSQNNSYGSDYLLKQNVNNSNEMTFADKISPGKRNLSKFNYNKNFTDSPVLQSRHVAGRKSAGNAYLFASSELNSDHSALNEAFNRNKQSSFQKVSTQANESLNSSKLATKQFFFQKCVSELGSPLATLPNVKNTSSMQYHLQKQQLNNGNPNSLGMSDQIGRKTKHVSRQSIDGMYFSGNLNATTQNSSNHPYTHNTTNSINELPKLEPVKSNTNNNNNTGINAKSNNNRLSLNLNMKPLNYFLKDKTMNSLAGFDDLLSDDKMISGSSNKFRNSFMQSDNKLAKNSQSMNNLSLGLVDRQSINHQQYQQLQRLQKQKEKDEYFQEEVAKVKDLWQQYENQRVVKKEMRLFINQQQQHLNLKTEGSTPSPLKFQRDEFLKDLKQKQIENKKQEFFNEMISSVKQQALTNMTSQVSQVIQNSSLLLSPKEKQTFILSPRNMQTTLSAIPSDLLYSKEDQIKQSVPDLIKTSSELIESTKLTQNNTTTAQTSQNPTRLNTLQTYLNLGEGNEACEEGFWESTGIWENIVKDSFEIIIKEKIIVSSEFNYLLLLDFLNNVVGRNFQNNEKYMRESLKLIGFTPEVSEIVCERITRLMNEKYGIKTKEINKFMSLYHAYERAYLSWNLIDRMGGKGRIEEVVNTYVTLINTNPSISGAFRLLNISNDLISKSFFLLLSLEERRHKQYFKAVQHFFKSPIFRVSHTKFFYTTKFYLERSLAKNKIQQQYKNRIYLLVEQMRFFVTIPLPQDAHYLLPQQTASGNSGNRDGSKSPSKTNKKKSDEVLSPSKGEPKQEETPEELYPLFCQQLGATIRNDMMAMMKIKQALIKHSQISLNNKSVFESYLIQLIQIFVLNNNDSFTYFELLNNEKFRTIILLTDDFFQIFSKLLMENLVKNLHCSVYICKDTHKRLQHMKILIHRLNNNFNSRLQKGEVIFSVSSNIESNYIGGGCFFNELYNHPNAIEFILDKLDDIYHNKSELNKMCTFSKVHRSRALCRYILSYLYPFVDQNGYSEFVSAFDFQCYVTMKKLKQEFFIEFRRVLKDLFIHQFNFPVSLVSRLTQEFSYALHGIEFFQTNSGGFGLQSAGKNQQSNYNNDEFDDEKQEF